KQQRVRIVSLEALGRLKPPDKEIIATCMTLAKADADPEIQRFAVSALGKIGPQAKEAVPLLMELRNSKTHNETVRGEAHKALKLVDERRGLMGLTEDAKTPAKKK
ncbi:MAG TPA: HEAT repeat domain-containing protein, partial [Pirellulaceae bacterium]|nr:HEAT repeat domain-containing protein [Pirellulaceae bacterium]